MGEAGLNGVLGEQAVRLTMLYRRQIEESLRRGNAEKDYDFQWILDKIRDREMQVWVSETTLILTQIQATPKRKILVIFATVSRGLDMDLINGIKDFARSHGCDAITFTGRKGWFRRFPDATHAAAITIEV